MSSIKEIRTFLDIQDAIIGRAKLEDKTSVRETLKEKINTAYQLISFEEPYRWSGITYPLRLRAKYTTGTVALTNGSDLVTGTSTAWTQFAHQGLKFYAPGVSVPYTILRIAEATQVATLSAPWTGTTVASAGTYTIFKDEYGLYPDYQSPRKFWLPSISMQGQPLPVGPNEMDDYRARYAFRGGTPRKYTINGYNIYTEKTWATFNLGTDFWEDNFDTQPRNYNLIVWPAILTTDTIAMFRYTRIPPMLNADADEPLIPYGLRMRLVYDVLLDHFSTNRDQTTKGIWKSEQAELKRKMAADIETTDDELVLQVDRRTYSRNGMFGGDFSRDYDTQ